MMFVKKQNAGLLRSARSWRALGLFLALTVLTSQSQSAWISEGISTVVFAQAQSGVTIATVPLQCPADELSTVLQAGENDSFDPDADAPLALPTPAFQAALGVTPVGFDSVQTNMHFAHSFAALPLNITAAQIEIRLKPIGGGSENDAINFWVGTNSVTPASSNFLGGNQTPGVSLIPPWNTANYPNGHVFLLNFGPAIVSAMSGSGGALHVQIQDDTSVDYVILRVCSQPPGQAEICIFKFEDLDGDGMRDFNANNPNDPNNEPLLSGWTFNVTPGPPTSVTTLAGGGICFGVLAPGTHTITEQLQGGWTPTTPNPQTVMVQPGQLVNVFFGNKQEGQCDLAIQKEVTPNPVASGGTVTFTLTVTNVGKADCQPGPFPGTIVRDNQPAGLAFPAQLVSVNQPGWQCSFEVPTPNLTCATMNTLPVNYQVTFTFTATVTASPGSSIQNCATVTNANDTSPPNDLANNQSCVTIVIPPLLCDLAITKEATPNPVASGGTVTIKLTVTNVGTAPCLPGPQVFGTAVQDPRPTGLAFTAPPVPDQPGWQCSLGIPTGDASCGGPGLTMPPGYTVVFTLTATVTAPEGSTIQNCATVANDNDTSPPNDPANNQSCVTIQVSKKPPPDLTLRKTLNGALKVEQEATYLLRVTNVGQSPTTSVIIVTDVLPSGLAFVRANGTGWSCTGGQVVTCTTRDALAPDQSNSLQITVRVQVRQGTKIINCALVTTVDDAKPNNNRDCVTETVQ